MRTGTIATGSFSYDPPEIMAIEPNALVFGEPRPILVCGTSFGAGLPVKRSLSFGGRACLGITDLNLTQAMDFAESRNSTLDVSEIPQELFAFASCLLCSQLEWSTSDLSRLGGWPTSADVRLSVAGREIESNDAQFGDAPSILVRDTESCYSTTGGTAELPIEISGEGFGTSAADVDFVLVSGFNLEKRALEAGLNTSEVVESTSEGIVNASRLFHNASLMQMQVPSWRIAAAIPVVDDESSNLGVRPMGNVQGLVQPAVWKSSESIQMVLPPGAGRDIQLRVQLIGGAVSRPETVRYCTPVIEEISPNYILAGDSNASITLRGQSFPMVLDQLDDLRIGGVQCKRTRLVKPGLEVSCIGLNWIWPEEARAKGNRTALDGIGVIGSTWPSAETFITVLGSQG